MTLEVSSEENCEEAHKRKSFKYVELMPNCKDKDWSFWLFPVEVAAKDSQRYPCTCRSCLQEYQEKHARQS